MGLRARKPLLIVGATALAIVVGASILRALSEIEVGDALEAHITSRGALVSRVGGYIAGVALFLCAVVAYGLKWRHQRQERKYEEILRSRANAANTAEAKSAGTDS